MYLPSVLARDSLDTNPPIGVVAFMSRNGARWLWTVTAIHVVVLLFFMAWGASMKAKKLGRDKGLDDHHGHHDNGMDPHGMGHHGPTAAVGAGPRICHDASYDETHTGYHDSLKKYHSLAVMIVALGAVAYFIMASNLGYTGIATEFGHHIPPNETRQVWYARWVYYVLTMPLIALLFTLHGRATVADSLLVAFMAAAWPAALLIGGLIRTSYKWGLYAFAVLFFLYQMFLLAVPCRRASTSTFGAGVGAFALFGVLYFIAWGCAEGGNVISPTGEQVWYGILDVFFKPFFLGFYLCAVREVHDRHREQNRRRGLGRGVPAGTVEAGHSPRLGKKMFGRRGHHDAPMTEKGAREGVVAEPLEGGTGMGTGAGPMGTGTGPMGTGTGTTGTMGTNAMGPGTNTMGPGTGAMGTGPTSGTMGTGAMGTGTGTGPVGASTGRGTGFGHDGVHNTGLGHDGTHTTGLGHSGGMREANPRLSEQTAVSDGRY